MKDYLIANGFEYKEYPDGWFWVKFLSNEGDCLQCDSNFKNCTAYIDGWVYEYDRLVEFKQIVSKYK